ncbi:hypothetical protein C8046_12595 [Serinibacter arcticus]|uniref:Uncharacterized protein n=1 Tax=Serinibacter arcticus TaxID=1655435 RepID=A0A2U1ZWL5_9MICO|nr:hypothetical protein [Serinibacter arcticus]PWD51375.1 hypothetical protein C8046_12595 [Serinibacter arcticus]
MPRDAPAFPSPGEVGEGDLAAVVRGVLCAPDRPWCTAVLRGRWPGGQPLGELWRADAVHPEGDGLVVVLDGGRRVLTLTRPRGARVVHTRDLVSVTIARVDAALLEDDGRVRRVSFRVRGGVARGAASGETSSWPRARAPWRRVVTGQRPLPAVELVAIL